MLYLLLKSLNEPQKVIISEVSKTPSQGSLPPDPPHFDPIILVEFLAPKNLRFDKI